MWLESSLEVGRPVEEKNDGLVQEGEAVAWAGAVLVSEEDGDGGSMVDGFGDGMEKGIRGFCQ